MINLKLTFIKNDKSCDNGLIGGLFTKFYQVKPCFLSKKIWYL